jgi:hypothetical protein
MFDEQRRRVEESISIDTNHMIFYLDRKIINTDGEVAVERVSMAHTTVQVIIQAAELYERRLSNS